jgi:hypothetical protein
MSYVDEKCFELGKDLGASWAKNAKTFEIRRLRDDDGEWIDGESHRTLWERLYMILDPAEEDVGTSAHDLWMDLGGGASIALWKEPDFIRGFIAGALAPKPANQPS